MSSRNLGHIETMRALAALAVAGFHFTHFTGEKGALFTNETLKNCTTYGAQGVELFFIISGFIIPFALDQSGYKILNYFQYLAKRVVRLFPTYLAAIGGIIVMDYILCRFVWYTEFDLHVKKTLTNVLFLGDVFPEYGWINPIFKTLKVEFQFYLLIGLLFPLISKSKVGLYTICIALLTLGILTKDDYTVFINAPFFISGMMAYFILKEGWNIHVMIVLFLTQAMLFGYFQWEDIIATLVGLLMLLFVPKKSRFLHLTGKISYSFYLIHGLLGGWFLYFTTRGDGWENYNWLLFIAALLISWLGAWIMYQLIEKPCLAWSAKIKYRL